MAESVTTHSILKGFTNLIRDGLCIRAKEVDFKASCRRGAMIGVALIAIALRIRSLQNFSSLFRREDKEVLPVA